MKQKIFTIIATSVLLLGIGACKDKNDDTALPSQQEMEESLTGLWYEEFNYEDVTENATRDLRWSEGCSFQMAGDRQRAYHPDGSGYWHDHHVVPYW